MEKKIGVNYEHMSAAINTEYDYIIKMQDVFHWNYLVLKGNPENSEAMLQEHDVILIKKWMDIVYINMLKAKGAVMNNERFSKIIDNIFWFIAPLSMLGAVPEHIVSYYLTRNINDNVRMIIVWGILAAMVCISIVKYIELCRVDHYKNMIKTMIIPATAILILIISVLVTKGKSGSLKGLIATTIYMIPIYIVAACSVVDDAIERFTGSFKYIAIVLLPGTIMYCFDVVKAAPNIGGDFKGLVSISYLSMSITVCIIIAGLLMDAFVHGDKALCKNNIINIVCMGLYAICMSFTGGRAAFLAIVCGICVYIAAIIYWTIKESALNILNLMMKFVPVIIIVIGLIFGNFIAVANDATVMSPINRLIGGMKSVESYVEASEKVTERETASEQQSMIESEPAELSDAESYKQTQSVSNITMQKIKSICTDDKVGFFDAVALVLKKEPKDSPVWNECYNIQEKSAARIYLNKLAFYELRSHMITGMGVYGFQSLYMTYPHNIFSEALADWGVIWGGIFIALVIIAYIIVVIAGFKCKKYVPAVGIVMVLLAFMMLNGSLYTCYEVIALFTWAVSIILRFKYK